ncbi:MAG: hypothetical protein CL607_03870 [Anaerolineaceae bacterium]|nr:hypothetical protein [Anaerolineaceae bacterium]
MGKTKSGKKPGQPAPASGQYIPIGPRGGTGKDEVTIIKGKPLPPTPKPNQTWKIVDRSKNKSGKG